MTDRQPDDLYDALRNRLADYGQEPPAQLWTGIRAQLPPPVAPPQLRRRRRWSPVLLLGLLLTVVAGAAWQWWRTGGPGQSAARTGRVAVGGKRGNTNTATVAGVATAAGAAQASADSTKAVAFGQTSTAKRAATDAAILGASAQNAELSVAENRRATASVNKKVAASSRTAAAGRGRRPSETGPGPLVARGYAANSARPTARAGTTVARAQAEEVGVVADEVASGEASAQPARAAVKVPAAPAEGAATGIAPPESAAAPAVGSLALNTGGSRSQTSAGAPGEELAVQSNAGRAGSLSSLLLRAPALQTIGFPRPVVQASADTVPAVPVVAARRWALQLLGGPAQTFRTLGANAGLSPLPRSLSPGSADFGSGNIIANELAKKEQSSTGFGLQVQARRLLSGRWGVSAGLGYQEYATRTDFSGPIAYAVYSGPNGSTRASREFNLSQRDTYRFATVPLRVSYALGQASKRLRYGLLAGTDVAWYLGGRTSATNRATAAPSAGESPYRPISLSVTAGLDLHYRVAPRLELLAQPNATYFLTSLSKPFSGLTPRYPWGAGALLGVSYDLK